MMTLICTKVSAHYRAAQRALHGTDGDTRGMEIAGGTRDYSSAETCVCLFFIHGQQSILQKDK